MYEGEDLVQSPGGLNDLKLTPSVFVPLDSEWRQMRGLPRGFLDRLKECGNSMPEKKVKELVRKISPLHVLINHCKSSDRRADGESHVLGANALRMFDLSKGVTEGLPPVRQEFFEGLMQLAMPSEIRNQEKAFGVATSSELRDEYYLNQVRPLVKGQTEGYGLQWLRGVSYEEEPRAKIMPKDARPTRPRQVAGGPQPRGGNSRRDATNPQGHGAPSTGPVAPRPHPTPIEKKDQPSLIWTLGGKEYNVSATGSVSNVDYAALKEQGVLEDFFKKRDDAVASGALPPRKVLPKGFSSSSVASSTSPPPARVSSGGSSGPNYMRDLDPANIVDSKRKSKSARARQRRKEKMQELEYQLEQYRAEEDGEDGGIAPGGEQQPDEQEEHDTEADGDVRLRWSVSADRSPQEGDDEYEADVAAMLESYRPSRRVFFCRKSKGKPEGGRRRITDVSPEGLDYRGPLQKLHESGKMAELLERFLNRRRCDFSAKDLKNRPSTLETSVVVRTASKKPVGVALGVVDGGATDSLISKETAVRMGLEDEIKRIETRSIQVYDKRVVKVNGMLVLKFSLAHTKTIFVQEFMVIDDPLIEILLGLDWQHEYDVTTKAGYFALHWPIGNGEEEGLFVSIEQIMFFEDKNESELALKGHLKHLPQKLGNVPASLVGHHARRRRLSM